MAARLKLFLLRSLRELSSKSSEELLEHRYDRFRQLGVFWEGTGPVSEELPGAEIRIDSANPVSSPSERNGDHSRK
jgi:hypothetical protein